MKFTQHYTVKWHDTDSNRCVRPSCLLMYLQETANLQLAGAGVSLDTLRDERGLAFLLSTVSLRIYEALHTGDEIDVETWVCEGRGLRYNRCFRILHGERVAVEASSVWGLMDLRERRLMRADDPPYQLECEPMLELDLPRRLRMPHREEMENAGERRIVYSDIDYNGHMNNTHYPDLFCDFTPDVCRRRVTGMMISFLHEAAFGHTLTVLRTEGEEGFLFRTVDADGTVCTEALVATEWAEG